MRRDQVLWAVEVMLDRFANRRSTAVDPRRDLVRWLDSSRYRQDAQGRALWCSAAESVCGGAGRAAALGLDRSPTDLGVRGVRGTTDSCHARLDAPRLGCRHLGLSARGGGFASILRVDRLACGYNSHRP